MHMLLPTIPSWLATIPLFFLVLVYQTPPINEETIKRNLDWEFWERTETENHENYSTKFDYSVFSSIVILTNYYWGDSSTVPNNTKVTELTVLEFSNSLLPSQKNKFLDLAELSVRGCVTDLDWHTYKGSCVQTPNLAAEGIGGRVIEVLGSGKELVLNDNHIIIGRNTSEVVTRSDQNNVLIKDSLFIGRAVKFSEAGRIRIKLGIPAVITGLTIHHPPRRLLLEGYYRSAPKKIELYGVRDEGVMDFFGQFKYLVGGLSAQTFIPQKFSKLKYSTVEIRILSNHGNPVYTALYRVEIHGITGKPWFLPADILYNDEDPCEVIRDEKFIPYQFNLLLLFTFMASLRAIHVTYLGAN